MSNESRYDRAHRGFYENTDRSIGIIPGLLRSAYRYGLKALKVIGRSIAPEEGAQEHRYATLERGERKNRKLKMAKTSVYQLGKSSGVPGAWKESVESLTVGT
ncbi:uncharacterized protein RSE6_11045 [Rhynchosporium secalis]|uniref:Uncharacterized protein n=1 Tax=Rhynchosporium secalis TaxID=38038 RepID=A0A1E1MLZ0_RHYSE|nr:uncharacterized protein RSE6_11045 [Rhynchosporium secalis]